MPVTSDVRRVNDMKTFHALFISALVLGACGCSNDLSRPKAVELISAQQRLPMPQTITVADRYLKRSWNRPVVGFGTVTLCTYDGETYADVEQRLLYYQAQGLISVGFVTNDGNCPAIWATVSLTNDGKKYVSAESGGVHQVKVFDLAFGEVTGIQPNEQFTAARADYTLKMINVTPFGGNIALDQVTRSATFARFDDGWRIEPVNVRAAAIRFQDAPQTAAVQEARRAVAAAEAAGEEAQQRAEAEGERQRVVAAELEARQQEEARKMDEARALAARAEDKRSESLIDAVSRRPCDDATARAMLDQGVDLRKADYNSRTALMNAARNGCTEIVRLIIQHGADINHRNSPWNMSALDWARREKRSDVVDLLIKSGAK